MDVEHPVEEAQLVVQTREEPFDAALSQQPRPEGDVGLQHASHPSPMWCDQGFVAGFEGVRRGAQAVSRLLRQAPGPRGVDLQRPQLFAYP
ncbi:hypothetical protein HDA40_006005 [Hamadaea flava]|nr:hypothetical protein [Hamadaea flava]MCP2327498.1 hypothetical protein [Hamadaea flava]